MEAHARIRPFGKLVGGGAMVAGVAALAVSAFTWPAARLEPRDLPVGVAGPAPAAAAFDQRLAERGNFFDVHRYASEAHARRAIEERDVYGALVVSAEGTTLLTASAASPLVAQMLEQALAPAAPAATRVVDVVPADRDDPRGFAFNSLLLPLSLVATVTGLIVAVATRPGLGQIGGLVAAAALAALVAISIVQGWLGVLDGDWWANTGVVALIVLAIASLAAGLAALFGVPGFLLAALLMIFVGNPLSGVSTAPALLPEWASLLGQLLPPGAGGSLLRSSAFFDGNGSAGPLTVLLAWGALGLAAVWVGARLPGRGRAFAAHPAAGLRSTRSRQATQPTT
jgi:hypothetical protein